MTNLVMTQAMSPLSGTEILRRHIQNGLRQTHSPNGLDRPRSCEAKWLTSMYSLGNAFSPAHNLLSGSPGQRVLSPLIKECKIDGLGCYLPRWRLCTWRHADLSLVKTLANRLALATSTSKFVSRSAVNVTRAIQVSPLNRPTCQEIFKNLAMRRLVAYVS